MMKRHSSKGAISTLGRALAFSLPVMAAQVLVPAALQQYTDASLIGTAHAQEAAAKPEQKTRKTPALRNKVYEKLSEAQKASEEKRYSEALNMLNAMVDQGGKNELNSYELANVYNLYAFIYYSQENFKKALWAYEQVVAQPDLPVAMETNTKYTIAQLYFVLEEWQKGINALNAWFKVATNPGANAYVLLGQGYYQLKNYDLALKNTQKAVDMYKEKGKVPKEQWYSLLRYLHYEKGNMKTVVGILNELLTHYPKKQYWVQLSHMYSELKNDKKQLAAMETAYVQGLLDKEKELLNMAYLFLGSDVPYKAAKVLDKGIKAKLIEPTSKNLELLGNAWRAAQEVKKAIPEMARAAEKSDKGDLWARLGNIYLDNDQYKQAADAVNAGLKKGGVKRTDTANLVLGMAYFNLKKYDAARKAFLEAKKDKRSRTYAEQWIAFMDKELERQRSLAEG